jgi:hypothetical protein
VARYQLFVDDSGTREYDNDRNYTTSGKSLYFAYGAIFIEQNLGAQLVPQFRELKRLTFGRADVEVKSNWLRMPDERRMRYLDPFGITDDQLNRFVDDYYRLIVQAPLVLIGSIVNKLHMQEDYGPPRTPYYAPTVAYEFLLQRAVQAVPNGSTLAVTVDDISGTTPKRRKYKTLLAQDHARLRATGFRLQPGISFACLDSPVRFVLSQHSDMIQAADLVSYCVHRQFRDHGEEWETPLPGETRLPMYPTLSELRGNSGRTEIVASKGLVSSSSRCESGYVGVFPRPGRETKPRLKTLRRFEGGPLDREHTPTLVRGFARAYIRSGQYGTRKVPYWNSFCSTLS